MQEINLTTHLQAKDIITFRTFYNEELKTQTHVEYIKIKIELFDIRGLLTNTIIKELKMSFSSTNLYDKFDFFSFNIKETITKIKVYIICKTEAYSFTILSFAGISLTKERAGTVNIYDEQNLIEAINNGITNRMYYTEDTEVSYKPNTVVNNGQVKEVEYNEDYTMSEELGIYGTTVQYTYDNNFKLKSLKRVSDTNKQIEQYTYNGDTGLLMQYIGVNNQPIQYEYSNLFYNLVKVLNSPLRDDVYRYDNKNRYKGLTIIDEDTLIERNLNSIDYNEKSQIEYISSYTSFKYLFNYNADGQMTTVRVDKNNQRTTLLNLEYMNEDSTTLPHTGLITKKTIGYNGDVYTFNYNFDHDISEIYLKKKNETESKKIFEFTYDERKRLYLVEDFQEEASLFTMYYYNIDNQVTELMSQSNSTIYYIYDLFQNIINKRIYVLDKMIAQSYVYKSSFMNFNPETFYFYIKRYYIITDNEDDLIYSCFLNEKNNGVISKDLTYKKTDNTIDANKIVCCSPASLVVTSMGLIPYIHVRGNNYGPIYSFNRLYNNHMRGTFMFWFKITGDLGNKRVFTLGNDSQGANLIEGIFVTNKKLHINVYDNMDLLVNVTTSLAFENSWNFIGLTWDISESGSTSVIRVFLNGANYSINIPSSEFEFDNTILFGVGCNIAEATESIFGSVTGIMLNNRKAFSIEEVENIRMKSKSFMFKSIYGATESPTTSAELVNNYNVDMMNNVYECIPLHTNLVSLKNKAPFLYRKRETIIGDADPVFDYNKKIYRTAYVTDNQQLVYNTELGNKGVVFFNAYFEKEKKLQTIIDLSSNAHIMLSINQNNELLLDFASTTYHTDMNVNVDSWNYILVAWKETAFGVIPRKMIVKVILNDEEYNIEIVTDVLYRNMKLSIGSMLNTNYEAVNPMYGLIEMVTYRTVYPASFTSLRNMISIVSKTIEYDTYGRAKYNRLTKNGTNIITKEYSFSSKVINNVIYSTNNISNECVTYANSSTDINYFYTYDNFNKVKTIKKGSVLQRSYTYDVKGYLVEEILHTVAKKINYTYDNRGNILSKIISQLDGTVISTISYEYNQSIYKDGLTKYNGTTISYGDALKGNPTAFTKNASTYNLVWTGSKLKELSSTNNPNFTNIKYIYGVDGLRRKKIKDGTITTYHYENNRLIGDKRGNYLTFYLYDEKGLLYGIVYNSNKYYYVRNILGEITGLINESGVEVVNYEYDSYGNILSITGSMATTLGTYNPFRYKGYYYDEETGLYYCNSRFYNPEWGRWISPDSIDYLDPESINGLNLYAYCGNDPVNMVDPSGHFGILAFFGIVGISALLGAIDGGVSAVMMGQDFWKGAAAGAIGGAIGGAISCIPGAGIVARGINSLIYDVTNEYFQTGTLENLDVGMLVLDVAFDMAISSKYASSISNIGKGILKDTAQNIFSSAYMGIIDGAVDIIQTGFFYVNWPQKKSTKSLKSLSQLIHNY